MDKEKEPNYAARAAIDVALARDYCLSAANHIVRTEHGLADDIARDLRRTAQELDSCTECIDAGY